MHKQPEKNSSPPAHFECNFAHNRTQYHYLETGAKLLVISKKKKKRHEKIKPKIFLIENHIQWTVRKFYYFSITQILCEFNFEDYRSEKSAK